MKKYILLLLSITIILSSYFFINYNVKNNTELFIKNKNKIPIKIKYKIRSFLTKMNTLYFYKKNDFVFEKRKKNILLNKNIPGDELHLYTNSNLIFTGPRSYFASNQENLFLITGTGVLMTIPLNDISKNNEKIKFKKINTNLDEFTKEYKDGGSFFSKVSIVKSLLYKNELFLVSIVQKFNESCYKHVILEGELKNNKILFKEFFKIDECRTFYIDYVGGTLADYKNDKILYTVGDWAICEDPRWLENNEKGFCTKNSAQSMLSALGKIYEINFYTKESKIISIGHDNPQGIVYDPKNNIIFSTEHGPQGGDELNININPSTALIKNYGYPISSYGEHYGYPDPKMKYKYEEAPLYKSHKKYGFEEPLDYFVPSIGISDIEKLDNKLLVASMGGNINHGDLSFYIYTLNNMQEIENREIFPIHQRIRDIHILKNYIILFLETTGTIALYERN